jgi:hypothetical protein
MYVPSASVASRYSKQSSSYSEAIDLLYETPTFLFHDYYAIITFMSSILPQRFNAIRSLYIDQRGAGFNATSDWRFNERNNFNCTRHRNTVIRNPLLTSGKVAPKELSSFRLIAEIVCRMPALQELHLDLMFNGLFPLKYIMTIERPDAEIVEEVAPVIEMLQLKILEGVKVKATFDRLPGEAAHWIDLPFVQVRGWI